MDPLPLLDELQIIARNGLRYGEDGHDSYDRERYERILHLVSEWYGRSIDCPPQEARSRLRDEVGHVTPKVGAAAAVFDDDGRILLIQQPADHSFGASEWTLPGGYSDSGESPEQTAIRETREETTLEVEPVELLSAEYSEPPQNGPHGGVVLLYLCEVTGGTPRPSHESQAVKFWDIEAVPSWFNDAEQGARLGYEEWQASHS